MYTGGEGFGLRPPSFIYEVPARMGSALAWHRLGLAVASAECAILLCPKHRSRGYEQIRKICSVRYWHNLWPGFGNCNCGCIGGGRCSRNITLLFQWHMHEAGDRQHRRATVIRLPHAGQLPCPLKHAHRQANAAGALRFHFRPEG